MVLAGCSPDFIHPACAELAEDEGIAEFVHGNGHFGGELKAKAEFVHGNGHFGGELKTKVGFVHEKTGSGGYRKKYRKKNRKKSLKKNTNGKITNYKYIFIT